MKKMKMDAKRTLVLSLETLRMLTAPELTLVGGGVQSSLRTKKPKGFDSGNDDEIPTC